MNEGYIIAEISAKFCGKFEIARDMVASAKRIGADAVKVQTLKADTMTINCKTSEFIVSGGTLWDDEYLYDLYKKNEMPWEWQKDLKQYAEDIGIDFFSTPYDPSAVDFLESIDISRYKISSFEAYDYPLIRYAAKCGKPMIISTGISTLEEMQGAIDACKAVGNNDITLLKCTSSYPAKLSEMNLLTIKDMIGRFGPQGVKIGLSDHSMQIEPVVTAVALGACVIEKHFTLDRALGGADAGFSLNADEFAAMVKAVRNTEAALGKVDYSINEANRKFGRSLYAVKDIKKGEIFTHENIRSIRPGNGLHPEMIEKILQQKATMDIDFGQPLTLSHIKI